MMVIGFGSDGRRYVIDIIRDKMKLSEKTVKILELTERWRPSVIFWEENASVEGGEHIKEVIDRKGWAGLEFYAFRQPTSISKEDRIGMLEPDFRAGNILFMMDRWYRMYDGKERGAAVLPRPVCRIRTHCPAQCWLFIRFISFPSRCHSPSDAFSSVVGCTCRTDVSLRYLPVRLARDHWKNKYSKNEITNGDGAEAC